MKIIQTTNAPEALGHYSQALATETTLYVSGQLPIDPKTGIVADTITEQTIQTLENLNAILEASGSKKQNVLKVTIFFKGLENWGAINNAYAEFFGTHKPARSAVPVPDLPKGSLLEIEAIASL